MKIVSHRTVKEETPKPVKKSVPAPKKKKVEEPVIKPLIEDNPFLTTEQEN